MKKMPIALFLLPREKRKQPQIDEKQKQDSENVTVLLQMMIKAVYGSQNIMKSMKEDIAEAVQLAEKEHDIKRKVRVWIRKIGRMKTDYSNYISRLKQSGIEGNDPGLQGVRKKYRYWTTKAQLLNTQCNK